tara:strand:+ start:1163 stop:1339 length:177 start_codon:yes stop_codon:yes gene_type:complete
MSLLKVSLGNNPLFPESIKISSVPIIDRKRQTLTKKWQLFVKKRQIKIIVIVFQTFGE